MLVEEHPGKNSWSRHWWSAWWSPSFEKDQRAWMVTTRKKLYWTNFFVAIKSYCNEKILMHIGAINSMAIGYCNKNFVAIAFVAINFFIIIKNTLLQQKNTVAIIYYNVIRLHTLRFWFCKAKRWIERVGKRKRKSVPDRRERGNYVIAGNENWGKKNTRGD